MKELIQSLSLATGGVLLAIVSASVVWVLCYVFPASLCKVWIVTVPFVLAYCLHCSPVWFFGESSQEYHTWMFLGVGSWFLAGAIPSWVVFRIFFDKDRSTEVVVLERH